MKKHLLRFSAALFVSVAAAVCVAAQTTGSVAITNATVVTASGPNMADTTIVIRNGLIEDIGKNIRVPADARVFDGKGLTVYPGFFDANTNLGIPKETPRQGGQNRQSGEAESNSTYPPELRAEETAAERLKAGEAQFKTHRDTGITTVLTVPEEGIFQGRSAIVNLAGETVPEMIVRPEFAQHVTFRTASGGVFPTSLMGTFAALRQMFLDARRLADVRKMYEDNPRGMRRPETDASLEALIPVVKGEMPVVFQANTEREMIRVLDLIREFNLKGIIAGGQESYKIIDRLKAQNVPVLLSLDFPVRTLSEHKEADPEPLETLRLRVEAPKNAARLKQAGVRFAFQSGEMKNIKDFLKNAGEATKNGLDKSEAIRAMTLYPAQILGVDRQLGSIEKGKIANLVVMKGDIFGDDREITHVFVDGRLFEQEEKKKRDEGKNDNGKPASVGGVWSVTVDVPGQSVPLTLTFDQQGSSLTGTMSSAMFGSVPIRNGRATSGGFTFDATVQFGGNELELTFNGRVTGNEVEGTVIAPDGPVAFSGSRNP